MKRLILAAGMVVCSVLPSARAAGSDFFTEDRDAGSPVDQISTPASADASIDSDNRNQGILIGKPIVRLDPRYGDICVETIFGKVNGAQVRVTW